MAVAVVICVALFWLSPLCAVAAGRSASAAAWDCWKRRGGCGGYGDRPASRRCCKRPLNLGDVIRAGETVTVEKAGKVDILWDRRALVSVEEHGQVMLQESQRGQTLVRLKQGTARVSLSYSAGRMTDLFTLEMPQAHVVTRGGVFEATMARPGWSIVLAKLLSSE
ncbi:MAG: hypothetical protein U0361_07295 [Nitrospiraceae bacterium]